MKISTARFGEINIADEEIIEFANGLLGFEKFNRYVILNTEDGSPFRWMQCVDDGDLAFVLIEPLAFMFEYDLEIDDSDVTHLGLEAAEDAVLFAIVTIPEIAQEMTANLQGPVVINAKLRKGRQVISNNQKHPIKARILEEMAKRAKRIQEIEEAQNSDRQEDEG